MSQRKQQRRPNGRKVNNRQPRPAHMKIAELALIKTYPKQVVMESWLPGTPQKFTTTVTTGVIQAAIPVNQNQVTSFATRFASTFVEYRIIRAKFLVRLFSSTNAGVLQAWIDEVSTNVPTLAEARERATLIMSASATDTFPVLKWVCGDTDDLKYRPIGTAASLATFKIYSDFANFGASIAATDYFEVEPEFQFQFRGLQGV
jgi:hypothetical protein